MAEDGFLYERYAHRVADRIRSGALAAGERLPSLRSFADQNGVSLSTAIQTYERLEAEGWIEARPKSGSFVRARTRMDPAPPEAMARLELVERSNIDERVRSLVSSIGHRNVVPLGAATLADELLPTAALNRALSGAARHEHAWTYGAPEGAPSLRRSLLSLLGRAGISAAPEDILVTAGAMDGVAGALGILTRPGDLVAVESPTHFGLLQLIENLGLRTLEIPAAPGRGLSLRHLERALRRHSVRACVFVPNFNNPLGSLLSDEDKEGLVALLSRHEVPLIEDDIYGELYFGRTRPLSCRSFDRRGLVVHVSSFSKSLAPGLRLGWVLPGRLGPALSARRRIATISGVDLLQRAAAGFVASGGLTRHLRRLRRALYENTLRMEAAVLRHFPAGTEVYRPQGGFVLWVRLPESVDALTLQVEALKHAISITPGPLCSATGGFSNYVRLNCGHGVSAAIERALLTLGQLASANASKRRRSTRAHARKPRNAPGRP